MIDFTTHEKEDNQRKLKTKTKTKVKENEITNKIITYVKEPRKIPKHS